MEKRILIQRWLGSEPHSIPIYDEASVSSIRARVRETGQQSNITGEVIATAALIASELAHNHLSHARQGYIAVRAIERQGVKGLELVAADLGPGIETPSAAIRGEAKHSGSLGAGLAAVCGLADEVRFDNRIGEGLCVVARKFEAAAAGSCDFAIMSKPYPGEPISGDDAVVIQSEGGFVAAVADGLGHGPEAREASNRAVEVLRKNTHAGLDQIALSINNELNGTRGCAIGLMRFQRQDAALEYVSAGDVQAQLYHWRDTHFFTPMPFMLGMGQLKPQKIRVEKVAVQSRSVLLMFTDGLKSRTNLKGELEMLRQPPIVIAEHLLRTQSRPDDDALGCVIRIAQIV